MPVLVTKWFGVFRVEEGKVRAEARFPLEAREIAARLLRIRRGEVLEEEARLGMGAVEVLEPRLKAIGRIQERTAFFDLDLKEPDRRHLHEAAVLLGREESRTAVAGRDRIIAQSVRAMDEVTEAVNTLVERMREWYGLHFPEALARVPDQSEFAALLAGDVSRAAVAARFPGLDPSTSIGVEFSVDELAAIGGFARSLQALYAERKRLERLAAREAHDVAPNLSQVAGDLIAARLIARAGTLERLAHLASSTLQTLGAETALFHHLKDGTKPPKHGILFQHGLVNAAPRWQRGRLARILAGKAQIAARMDFFEVPAHAHAEALVAQVEKQAARVRATAPRPRSREGPTPARRPARPAARRGRP